MRTIFSTTCMLIMLCSFPEVSAQKFSGGLLGGVSASQVSGDRLAGFDKAGIYGGFFANFSFSEHSAIQMEIDFIQKGSRKNPRPSKGDYEKYVLRLNYIEVPLLYKWMTTKSFGFEIGPAAAVLLKSSDVELDQNGAIPFQPAFNPYDFSVMAGVYFKLGEHLKTNLRFSNSVVPVRSHSGGATYRLNRGQYNSVIGLSLQYEF
jgi:hypothetical protein